LFGEGNGEWLGNIQNGSAAISLNKNGTGTWTLSGALSYSGDTTVNAGTLSLTSTSELTLSPTTNGTSNKVSGTGTVSVDGKINLNLAAANVTHGNSWLLVDVDSLTETYGSNFSITDFTKSGTDWVKVDGANTWTFSETTGTLSLSVLTDPFIPWIGSYFPGESNASIIGKNADPDNDGLNNLAEFALNSNPSNSTTSGKVIGKVATLSGNQVMTLTLPVRAGATFADDATTHEEISGLTDGVIYRIQGSANLSAWTLDVSEVGAGSDLDAIQAGLPALDAGWIYRTFRTPGTVSSDASNFLRVQLTE
jgi:autotransporter-associated beta strand protein